MPLTTIFTGHTLDLAGLTSIGPLDIEEGDSLNPGRSISCEVALVVQSAVVYLTRQLIYQERAEYGLFSDEQDQAWAQALSRAEQGRAELVEHWERQLAMRGPLSSELDNLVSSSS